MYDDVLIQAPSGFSLLMPTFWIYLCCGVRDILLLVDSDRHVEVPGLKVPEKSYLHKRVMPIT